MADSATAFVPILTSRQRRHPVELPEDPTEEELARDWALSAEDRQEALRCRGEANRLSFALQLCVVRHYGRFLDDHAGGSARILNFLSRQLDLPPVLAVEPSSREGTHQEHQRRIREYLGLQTFDAPVQERIERWVCGQAAKGLSAAEIFPHAEETLRLWDVLLPARSTLERLVASQTTRAQEEIFQRLSTRLTPECRKDLDSLLEVGGDHHPRSTLLRLKEYPPEATVATILSYLKQYALLRSLEVERIDASGLSPELTVQLAALVKRYDGYSFMPRIRDLADQQLYRIDRGAVYPNLAGIFRGGVDVDLIPEQWDQLVRVAASLKNRVCPAHVVVQRLANSSPSDRLAKALTMLGRVVKTIYILKYFNEEDLRHRVQLQLNRGEHRHSLGRWIFFADQGEFRTGDYQEIMNKASCLSLVSNAILVWNTLQITRIVETLQQTGTHIADEDLAHVSPLLQRHVIPNGTYHFPRAIEGDNLS